MSNTLRKDRNGKTFKESLKKKCGRTRCRCEYCTDIEKNKLSDKIAEKELKQQIKTDEYNDDTVWDKQAELCNDYCCTVWDKEVDIEEIVNKYVINYEIILTKTKL